MDPIVLIPLNGADLRIAFGMPSLSATKINIESLMWHSSWRPMGHVVTSHLHWASPIFDRLATLPHQDRYLAQTESVFPAHKASGSTLSRGV